ncbi:hypothetical protein [Paraburkholderia dinghuensis]|uniref:Uncharacterized protein n=1 Tax=Paraburkholderia dinghuensis TaxID=2305225 RepID=A0A3N6NKE1_9BURK|nr:hypothetical protein [Paraburkholderia dinghuensis]RQH09592.1 hypothetical protein D1Y85_00015 [Paraburkholderia dinghuensis]
MKITTLVLNVKGEPHFEAVDHLDIDELLTVAKERVQIARDKGVDWTMGAVTFFGGELVKAVNTGEHRDVTKAIIQMVMAAWLLDSLYFGITEIQYRESEFRFVVANDGAVSHTRVPATA